MGVESNSEEGAVWGREEHHLLSYPLQRRYREERDTDSHLMWMHTKLRLYKGFRNVYVVTFLYYV